MSYCDCNNDIFIYGNSQRYSNENIKNLHVYCVHWCTHCAKSCHSFCISRYLSLRQTWHINFWILRREINTFFSYKRIDLWFDIFITLCIYLLWQTMLTSISCTLILTVTYLLLVSIKFWIKNLEIYDIKNSIYYTLICT